MDTDIACFTYLVCNTKGVFDQPDKQEITRYLTLNKGTARQYVHLSEKILILNSNILKKLIKLKEYVFFFLLLFSGTDSALKFEEESKKRNIPCPCEEARCPIDVQNPEFPKVHLAQIIFCQMLKNWSSKRTLKIEAKRNSVKLSQQKIKLRTYR